MTKNNEFLKRISRMLSYADRHPNLEAAKRAQKVQEEYQSKRISQVITGTSIDVQTTALNIDVEALLGEMSSGMSVKTGSTSYEN